MASDGSEEGDSKSDLADLMLSGAKVGAAVGVGALFGKAGLKALEKVTGRATLNLKMQKAWNLAKDQSPEVRERLRLATNDIARLERELSPLDQWASTRDFLEKHKDLSPDDLREAQRLLAGWYSAKPSPAARSLANDYRDQAKRLIERINESLKSLGMETMDPNVTALHPRSYATDTRVAGIPVHEGVGFANALNELLGRNKGEPLFGSGRGMDQIRTSVKRSLDETLYFADGKVHSRTGRIPKYLLDESKFENPLSSVKSQRELDQWIEKESSTFSTKTFGKASGKGSGPFDAHERELPYIDELHGATPLQFAMHLKELETMALILDTADPETKANLQRASDLIARSGAKDAGKAPNLLGGTGDARHGSISSELDAMMGSPNERVTGRLGRVAQNLSGIASRTALSASGGASATQVGQILGSTLGSPMPLASLKNMARAFLGFDKYYKNPTRPRSFVEFFAKTNEKKMTADYRDGKAMFIKELQREEPSDFMLRSYSDDEIARARRMLERGEQDSPEFEKLSRTYAIRQGEITGTADLATSKPSFLRGDMGAIFGGFLKQPVTTLASQIHAFRPGGFAEKFARNRFEGDLRTAAGLIGQAGAQGFVRASPAAKAALALMGGSAPFAVMAGMRAYQGDLQGGERAAADAMDIYAALLQRAWNGDDSVDDSMLSSAAQRITDAALAAGGLATQVVPTKAFDMSTPAQFALSAMDKKMGYGSKQELDLLGEMLSMSYPSAAFSPLAGVLAANRDSDGGRIFLGTKSRIPFLRELPGLHMNEPSLIRTPTPESPVVNGVSLKYINDLMNKKIRIQGE